jgi:sigma-B regulation protein RsbU (phosphoserine phosphatase)
VPARLKEIARFLGRVGLAFVVFLLLAFISSWLIPGRIPEDLLRNGALVTGIWLAIRVIRVALRKSVWRLRNRLLVTYLFIAVVPIVLIVILVGFAAMALSSELAVYLVTTELDRRVEELKLAAGSIAKADDSQRTAVLSARMKLLQERFPGVTAVMRASGNRVVFPPNSRIDPPSGKWPDLAGAMTRASEYYLWAHTNFADGDISIVTPLGPGSLGTVVPSLGAVGFTKARAGSPLVGVSGTAPASKAPGSLVFLDREIQWFAAIPMSDWNEPGKEAERLVAVVRSRPSVLLAALFSRRSDFAQGILAAGLVIAAGLLIVVEMVSVIIGIRLTRTMTGAVHRLYEGTERVTGGDFSHRIEVKGDDQLAQLGRSFNRMTEHVEHLLTVEKEKERMQSELEIAREVQARLYPARAPETHAIRMFGVCHPARMVSGDYFDYEALGGSRIAVAIGDVAGKGISAALLMASLQSSLRAQIQVLKDDDSSGGTVSGIVSRINMQLHTNTAPEKYATFCFGVLDESSGAFTYTNAGHLPPLLVRDGHVAKLEVNGTVVGAFPAAQYSETCVQLQSGDLLVFYTDGVTEPENAYGEMFGEDRLTQLILLSKDQSLEGIAAAVAGNIQAWTGAGELQDDMTLLLIRKT